jgi:hypothetical protein
MAWFRLARPAQIDLVNIVSTSAEPWGRAAKVDPLRAMRAE